MYFYDRKIKDVHSWLQKIGLCRMKSFFFTSFLPSICASSTSSSSTSTIDILEFCRSTSGPPLQKNQAFKSDHLPSSDFVKITSSAHTEHFLSQTETRIQTKAQTRHRKKTKTKKLKHVFPGSQTLPSLEGRVGEREVAAAWPRQARFPSRL